MSRYIWSITGGALPPGLVMGQTGIIAGIPTHSGAFPVEVHMIDTVEAMETISQQIVLVHGDGSFKIIRIGNRNNVSPNNWPYEMDDNPDLFIALNSVGPVNWDALGKLESWNVEPLEDRNFAVIRGYTSVNNDDGPEEVEVMVTATDDNETVGYTFEVDIVKNPVFTSKPFPIGVVPDNVEAEVGFHSINWRSIRQVITPEPEDLSTRAISFQSAAFRYFRVSHRQWQPEEFEGKGLGFNSTIFRKQLVPLGYTVYEDAEPTLEHHSVSFNKIRIEYSDMEAVQSEGVNFETVSFIKIIHAINETVEEFGSSGLTLVDFEFSGANIAGRIAGGILHETYSTTLTLEDVTGKLTLPLTWSLHGDAPAGLYLINAMGNSCDFWGVPYGDPGYYNFTIVVTGANGAEITRSVEMGLGELLSYLKFNGADGSTDFTDETGVSWTSQGDAKITHAWSQLGVGSYTRGPSNDPVPYIHRARLPLTDTDDFTVSFFYRPNAFGAEGVTIFDTRNASGDSATSGVWITQPIANPSSINAYFKGADDSITLSWPGSVEAVTDVVYIQIYRRGQTVGLVVDYNGERTHVTEQLSAVDAPIGINTNDYVYVGNNVTPSLTVFSLGNVDELKIIGSAAVTADEPPVVESDYPIDPTEPLVMSGLPGLVLQESYHQQISVSGYHVAPLHFEVTSGSLPDGIELTSDGVLRGVCTSNSGNVHIFSIKVTDALGKNITSTYTVGVGTVISLMHFNGADGSTTFTDEAGISWSRQGSAAISMADSVFGGSSLYLNGVDAGLRTTATPPRTIDNKAMVFTGFIKRSGGTNPMVFFNIGGITTASRRIQLQIHNSSGAVRLYGSAVNNASTAYVLPNGQIAADTWTFVRLSCGANVGGQRRYRIWFDDVLIFDEIISSTSFNSNEYNIGRGYYTALRYFSGYVDEWRLAVDYSEMDGQIPVITAPSDYPLGGTFIDDLNYGVVNESYSDTIRLVGVQSPITSVVVNSGEVSGLTFNNDGTITGIPSPAAVGVNVVNVTITTTANGVYTVNVTVRVSEYTAVLLFDEE